MVIFCGISLFIDLTRFSTLLIGPAMIWTIIDENTLGLNDAGFAVCVNPAQQKWVDFPGFYHNNACGFAFLDGHSEIHKWLGSTIKHAVTGRLIDLNVSAGDSKNDIIWLSDVTTVAK